MRPERSLKYDNDNERRTKVIARCEATAGNHGHVLGVWHAVSEHLHASICEVCGEMECSLDTRPQGNLLGLAGPGLLVLLYRVAMILARAADESQALRVLCHT